MKKLLVLVLALCCLLTAAPAEEQGQPASQQRAISRFELRRGGYMVPRTFALIMLDGADYVFAGEGVMEKADPAVARELAALITEYDLFSWNGFHGSDPRALDGEDFLLDVAFTDGSVIHASGSNRFPKDYFAAVGRIEMLLSGARGSGDAGVCGTYRYEGAGFFGDFILTLNPDGTYQFSEGPLSSYLGGGEWCMEGMMLALTETNGRTMYNLFFPTRDALYFCKAGSDNFPYVKVPDRGRFLPETRAGETVELSFRSHTNRGPVYTCVIEDPAVVSYAVSREYDEENYEEIPGAEYTERFLFTGLRPGETKVTIRKHSAAGENGEEIYYLAVDEALNVSLAAHTAEELNAMVRKGCVLVLALNGQMFYADLMDNASAAALMDCLGEKPLELTLRGDGESDKEGTLPGSLPRSDAEITAGPGDLILRADSRITLCCGENTGVFTRLARIRGADREELLSALGEGDVQAVLWLEWNE